MKNYLPKDILWVLFLPPSDAYVRSFLYVLYTLIKLYYTKALRDQASSLAPDWILLLRGPRIPVYSRDSTTTFQLPCSSLYPGVCSHSYTLSWWWTWRPGCVAFMGLQRVGQDWATELNWSELNVKNEITDKNFLANPKALCECEKLLNCEDTGILGSRRRRIQSGARDEAWSLRAFV